MLNGRFRLLTTKKNTLYLGFINIDVDIFPKSNGLFMERLKELESLAASITNDAAQFVPLQNNSFAAVVVIALLPAVWPHLNDHLCSALQCNAAAWLIGIAWISFWASLIFSIIMRLSAFRINNKIPHEVGLLSVVQAALHDPEISDDILYQKLNDVIIRQRIESLAVSRQRLEIATINHKIISCLYLITIASMVLLAADLLIPINSRR